MCGIAGFWSFLPTSLRDLEVRATTMAAPLHHRGPDDGGAWADVNAQFALSHRRLAVLDLSPAGHQPMRSPSSRYVISFNGEIYNHADIRRELEQSAVAPAWRGTSDTETLLAAIECWGLEATLERTVGMFAMAVWDTHERVLQLARDRFGEKPLYYGWSQGAFLFGSELKALRAFPGLRAPKISREALEEYLRFMYVPAPLCIYEDWYKLEPGCLLTIRGHAPRHPPREALHAPGTFETMSITRWWSLIDVSRVTPTPSISEPDRLLEMEEVLRRAVQLQSLADVPVGAFLSGGIDSSLIAALMQNQSARPVKTFTVGFEESDYDEAPYARAVAAHIGSDHTELMVTARESQAVIASLPVMFDEPFADSSQIPMHIVCRAARSQVTVALSGDGGDEIFGGYNRYLWAPQIWKRLGALPYPARQLFARALSGVPLSVFDSAGRALSHGAHGRHVPRLGERAHKLADKLRSTRTFDDFYMRIVSEWHDPQDVVRDLRRATRTPAVGRRQIGGGDVRMEMMLTDSLTYLPDDILCKVDRAAMAVSLETRVPFLDHRVAELAWRLPMDLKIRNGKSKWALRQILYKHVPKALIERPKSGFALPIGQWLRGPLRGWAEELLDARRLEKEGFLNAGSVRAVWSEHLEGRSEHVPKLWSVLMFQAWLESVQ